MSSRPPLLECLWRSSISSSFDPFVSDQGNFLKGIENCLGAAHKAARFLWKQHIVTIFFILTFTAFQILQIMLALYCFRSENIFLKILCVKKRKGLFNLAQACIVDGDFWVPNEIDS